MSNKEIEKLKAENVVVVVASLCTYIIPVEIFFLILFHEHDELLNNNNN